MREQGGDTEALPAREETPAQHRRSQEKSAIQEDMQMGKYGWYLLSFSKYLLPTSVITFVKVFVASFFLKK